MIEWNLNYGVVGFQNLHIERCLMKAFDLTMLDFMRTIVVSVELIKIGTL